MAVKKEEKTFEESLVELESIVKELESGNVDLDKAIEKYSEAMKLAKTCSDKLNNATEKVNQILKENGVLEDFEIEE
ncbi:MAG: exodeoxyribonuclease VII small subunit [Bacilli bacterium]|nr:exodeoxyribonuclease VII small subunit [Bacilli bacterium]